MSLRAQGLATGTGYSLTPTSLTGKGTERLNASGRYDLASGSGTQTVTFSATAAGAVRLVKKVRGPAQTSGLILTLLPKTRFTLSLESLLGDGGGMPLTYLTDVDSKGPCDAGGFAEVRSTYDSGLYTTKSLSVCPGYTPTDKTEGAKKQQTIWGASVWTTEGLSGTLRPDLCRGRVDPVQPHVDLWPGRARRTHPGPVGDRPVLARRPLSVLPAHDGGHRARAGHGA